MKLATGARAFTGSTTMAVLMAVPMKNPLPPEQLNPGLPPTLCALILRLLAKRLRSARNRAQEVVAALAAISARSLESPPGRR